MGKVVKAFIFFAALFSCFYYFACSSFCGSKTQNKEKEDQVSLAITSIQFGYYRVLQAEISRQEARLKIEKENIEKEKSVLMGTASNQDNQDGALEITVSGEKYRCLWFAKAKKRGI